MPEYSQQEITDLAFRFPDIYLQAKIDWEKFKLGQSAGLFTDLQRQQVLDWFAQFYDYWQIIKPNWLVTASGQPMPTFAKNFAAGVDSWLSSINADRQKIVGLGIAPLIIAGILIAGAFGVAGAVWAVGYLKEQQNISNMIDSVVAGKLPASVLQDAIDKAHSSGIVGDISSVVKWAAVGLGIWLVVPMIKDLVRGK